MIKEDILWLDLMEILNYQIQGFFATMVLYFWAASDSHCGLCIITYNGPFRPMPMCTFFFRLGILSSLFFFFSITLPLLFGFFLRSCYLPIAIRCLYFLLLLLLFFLSFFFFLLLYVAVILFDAVVFFVVVFVSVKVLMYFGGFLCL